MRKYINLVLFLCGVLILNSCSGTGKEKLTVTDAEKTEGWVVFSEIGFKLKNPPFLTDNAENVKMSVIGDEDNEDEAVYKALVYTFKPSPVETLITEIMNMPELSEEEKQEKISADIIKPNTVKLYGLYVFRTPLIDSDDKISEITSLPNNKVIRKTDKYIHVFAFNNEDNNSLKNEEYLTLYKEFIEDIKKAGEAISVADPVHVKIPLSSLKEFKFKTLDFDGNEVTEEIFKNRDITLLNIWATWCAPCKAELPHLGNIHQKFSERNCQVIAICSDVTDKDDSALDLAKDIIKDANCTFINLRKNNSLNKIFSNLQGYPTSIFFDKDGNVIGDVIVGARSEEKFEKAFEDVIALLNK